MGLVTVTAPQAASAPAVNPPNVDKELIVEVESWGPGHAAEGKRRCDYLGSEPGKNFVWTRGAATGNGSLEFGAITSRTPQVCFDFTSGTSQNTTPSGL